MLDAVIGQDRAQRSPAFQDRLPGSAWEAVAVDHDRAELHRTAAAAEGQYNLSPQGSSLHAALEHAQVDPVPVERLQRWRHVPLVDEETPVRVGHLLAVDTAGPRQRPSVAGVELIER